MMEAWNTVDTHEERMDGKHFFLSASSWNAGNDADFGFLEEWTLERVLLSSVIFWHYGMNKPLMMDYVFSRLY